MHSFVLGDFDVVELGAKKASLYENQISGKVYTVEARSVIIIFMTLGKLTVTDCDGRGKRPTHHQAAVPNV